MKIYCDFVDTNRNKWQKWQPDFLFWVLFAITMIILFTVIINMARAETTPLTIAQQEIGYGEIGGNNKGVYVRQYLNGREGLPWCAGFISYCLKKAGYNLPYFLRAKSYLRIGKKVTIPQAGDLIIFSRQGGGHIEIISKVTKNNIWTIGGNVGSFSAKVREFKYNRNNILRLLAFIRIEKK